MDTIINTLSIRYDQKYKTLHAIDTISNYKNKINDVDKDLAEYIYKNYDTFDDQELKIIALKCLDVNKLKSIVLKYELANYQTDPIESISLEKVIPIINKILHRYQSKAGGFVLEDNEWKLYKNEDGKDVKAFELLFENTVYILDKDDTELTEYLDLLGDKLNSIAKNINVDIRSKSHKKDKIQYVLLWVTDIVKAEEYSSSTFTDSFSESFSSDD